MSNPVFGALIETAGKEPTLHIPSVRMAGGAAGFHVSENEYAQMERGFKRLSARSLLMASPQDSLILNRAPDREYLALLRHSGAGGANHVIPAESQGQCLAEDAQNCPDTLKFIRDWPGAMEFYMVSDMDERLARQSNKPLPEHQAHVTALLNDKVFFTRTLEDLGLPMIETYVGPSDSVAFRLEKDPGWPVVARSSRSVGGAAVWKAETATQRQALKKIVERRRGEVFLLQKWVPSVSSPNLQIYVGSRSICVLGLSIQKFHDTTHHAGNYFQGSGDKDVDLALLRQGKAIAMEAARLGYLGVLGVDFIVTANGDVFAMEINARHNTSTHALWFSNRLINNDPFLAVPPGRVAYMRWPSARGRLSAMEWMGILGAAAFDPEKGEGVLPFDCGYEGLEAAILAGDMERRQWLERMAEMAVA